MLNTSRDYPIRYGKRFTDRCILRTDSELNILNNDMCYMLLSDNLGMSLENTSDNRCVALREAKEAITSNSDAILEWNDLENNQYVCEA
jgi:hypothetical protein